MIYNYGFAILITLAQKHKYVLMQCKLIPLIIGQVFIKADGSSYHTKSFSFLNLTTTCLPCCWCQGWIFFCMWINLIWNVLMMLIQMRFVYLNLVVRLGLHHQCWKLGRHRQLWIMLVFLLQKVKVWKQPGSCVTCKSKQIVMTCKLHKSVFSWQKNLKRTCLNWFFLMFHGKYWLILN